ncbi:gamma-glutamyltransferase 2. Threonine peptidase. MEROPS family T03 [Friedmanniella luteola]|uniref:Gamma-glutamyltransferase 2. Threonine peptidase. MEROPS family T03 n=1 Tax=Friedmanniella luteola TaxID=546871 RepID=A0A1H1U4L0_9ACTN|nr:gamma-glutamyltransferase [Friedmanniella luteola]SDS67440.1 gamma-glutamyltransferase 2. Threonine peptidase. MEROPS family T03 [Friedmanniella luteola]
MALEIEPAGLGPGPRPAAVATGAMVATSHPAVTAAALEVLRAGGTAIDAALTAIPLQQVLEPQLSTIAGGFGMLIWDGRRSRSTYLQAGPDRPRGSASTAGLPVTSGARVAVPGTVAGLAAAAERLGTRPWASYFEPAVRAADEGFVMYGQLATAMAAARTHLVSHPSGEQRYTPDGYLPRVGQLFRQPALAATLARIAAPDGAEWFQRGAFAEHFVESVVSSGGVMSRADLAAYAPRWEEPLAYSFDGHDLVGPPLPDTGGLFCAIALGLAERLAITDLGWWFHSPRAIALVSRVLAEAEALTWRFGADPYAVDVPVELLLSSSHLDAVAGLIEQTTGGGRTAKGHAPPPARTGRGPVGSNQLVVVDHAGNWVCVLHTGYGGSDFGTGLVVDGVGVNAAGDFPGLSEGPGRRVIAPLASTMVLDDGRPELALGTPGLPPPCITLVLLNLLGHRMALQAAVEAPRIVVDVDGAGPPQVWRRTSIAAEAPIPSTTLSDPAGHDLEVRSLGAHHPSTGRVQAVLRDHGGRLLGVTDSRGSGLAAGTPDPASSRPGPEGPVTA